MYGGSIDQKKKINKWVQMGPSVRVLVWDVIQEVFCYLCTCTVLFLATTVDLSLWYLHHIVLEQERWGLKLIEILVPCLTRWKEKLMVSQSTSHESGRMFLDPKADPNPNYRPITLKQLQGNGPHWLWCEMCMVETACYHCWLFIYRNGKLLYSNVLWQLYSCYIVGYSQVVSKRAGSETIVASILTCLQNWCF